MSTGKELQAPGDEQPGSRVAVSATLAMGALGAGALNRLLSVIDEAVEVSSFEPRVLFVNRRMESLRSRTNAELLAMPPLWAEDELAGPAIDGVRQGAVWTGTLELPSGRIESVILPLRDARDRVVGCLTLVTPAALAPLLSSSTWERSGQGSAAPDSSGAAACSAPHTARSPACSLAWPAPSPTWDLGVERTALGAVEAPPATEPPTQRSSTAPGVQRSEAAEELQVRSRASLFENLGRMATAFAHDFNNMLSVIDGSANLALKRIAPGVPGREPILQIREAARRSARLTRQLLAMSRGMGVEAETLDLNAVIFGLEGLLGLIVSERVEIVSELAASPATVQIVRAQLEQVLLNLAVNARDAMPDGGKLVLRTYGAAGDDEVVLEVSDTGHGMPGDIAARAFDTSFTTKSNGNGLGLSIVKSVIEEAGGTLALRSEPGAGTTFVIRLPARRTVATTRPSPRPVERHRVLVVDDEGPVRRAVAKMVAANGFDVIVARDAGEALDLLRQEEVDLLLTDVVMPGMSGVALAEAVGDLHPEVAIVYMSGYAHDVILERGLDPSAMIYLQKPFTRLELLRKLAMALGTGQIEHEALQGE